jgi:RNA polymerase sigma factor (sigma-70 family)
MKPVMLDDTELLRRYAVEKSEPAFTEFVARHIDLVYSAALRQVGGDAHRARDVAQIVFATLARKAAMLVGHPALAGWLYNTTQHVARRAVRAEQRRRVREAEASRMSESDRSESGPIEWERIRPVLDDAMRELGERDREAVVLRFLARRPFAEIGRALGLNEDAARRRVERALEKLRLRLARRGVSSTAAVLSLALSSQAIAAAPAGMAATVAASAVTGTSAAAAGSAVALVEFMSMSKMFVGGATLVMALTFGGAVQEIRAGRAADAALSRVRMDRDLAHARLKEWETRTADAEADAARLKVETEALRATRGAEKSRASTPVLDGNSGTAEGDAFMTRHPVVKNLMIEGQRARLAGTYAPLFKLLQLTPAQIERFKEIAMQGRNDAFVGLNGELVRYSTGGDRRQAETEIRELLGEDGFRFYQDYFETTGLVFQTMTQLAGDLYHTSAPLSVQQAEQLQRILLDERKRTDWSGRLQFDWASIMAKARDILLPEQLSMLHDLSAHDKFGQAFTRARMRGEIK